MTVGRAAWTLLLAAATAAVLAAPSGVTGPGATPAAAEEVPITLDLGGSAPARPPGEPDGGADPGEPEPSPTAPVLSDEPPDVAEPDDGPSPSRPDDAPRPAPDPAEAPLPRTGADASRLLRDATALVAVGVLLTRYRRPTGRPLR